MPKGINPSMPQAVLSEEALWLMLRAKVAALLHVAEVELDSSMTFRQLKFDSLDLIELQMDLEQSLDVDLLEGSLKDTNVMDLRLDALVAHLHGAKNSVK